MKEISIKDLLSKEGYKNTTAEERRAIKRWENAKRYAGIRSYPTTCAAVCDTVTECVDEDFLASLTWKELGEVLKLAQYAYSKGVTAGKTRKDD